MEQELPSLLQSYELRGKQPFVSDFSRLLWHAIEKGRGSILHSKKKTGLHGDGKGENAGYPQCFPTIPNTNLSKLVAFILSSANALNSDWSKIFITW